MIFYIKNFFFSKGREMVETKKPEFKMTDKAVAKAKELMEKEKQCQHLRVGIAGGGCSGFSYSLSFTDKTNLLEDNLFDFDGLSVVVDKKSMLYLDGATLDYVEELNKIGFRFDNPNAGQTCGCSESFAPKE